MRHRNLAELRLLIDSIDSHLAQAEEIDRAAAPLGMYLAWCVNLGLVSDEVLGEHERMVLRIRMHDARGSELLVALGGELRNSHLNERGKAFTRTYYDRFLDDYRQLFGEQFYAVPDSWENYAKLSAVLTPRLLGPSKRRDAKREPGLFGGVKRRWHELWH